MHNDLTQYQKITIFMLRNINSKLWFYPFDFMQSGLGDLFVGYEASARLSELSRKYPDVFESQREGKYMKRKLNMDALKQRIANQSLDNDLRAVVVAEAGIALF